MGWDGSGCLPPGKVELRVCVGVCELAFWPVTFIYLAGFAYSFFFFLILLIFFFFRVGLQRKLKEQIQL